MSMDLKERGAGRLVKHLIVPEDRRSSRQKFAGLSEKCKKGVKKHFKEIIIHCEDRGTRVTMPKTLVPIFCG
ncbi:MAG: hypothetical protein OJF50_005116 [Nitrospira sp.]|nr:hypothetical protein [Nitrospira sp.]